MRYVWIVFLLAYTPQLFALTTKVAGQQCLHFWEGDAIQLKDEFGGLNAFRDSQRELEQAILSVPGYSPLKHLKKERAVYDAMLKQLGRRVLMDKDFRGIEVKENLIVLKQIGRWYSLRIEWTSDVTEIKTVGLPNDLTIKLPKNYVPDSTFEAKLDHALTGHDLDRFTTTSWVQDARGDDPRVILKPGQRQVLLHAATVFQSSGEKETTALTVQAPPGFGKTLFHIELAKMRMRRALTAGSMRNIYFEISEGVTNAIQLGDSFRRANDNGLSKSVAFDVVSMEDPDCEIQNFDDLLKHAEQLGQKGSAVVVTITWAKYLSLQSKLASEKGKGLSGLKARTNSILLDEASDVNKKAQLSAISEMINDNPGIFVLGTDAEFLDPRSRDVLFAGKHIDVYRDNILIQENKSSRIILEHLRIGSAMGHITPLVDSHGDHNIISIHPKEIVDELRRLKYPVASNGILFGSIQDRELRSAAFSIFAHKIKEILRTKSGYIHVNGVDAAEQWNEFLKVFSEQEGIQKKFASYHAGTPNRADVLRRYRRAPELSADERIDWIISPKSLDQGVDAPHASAVIILTNELNAEAFGEIAGRPLRRYVDKQTAVIVHLTETPMTEVHRLNGLTSREEINTQAMLDPRPPSVGTGGNVPKPFETSVAFVLPSPSNDPRLWDESQLLPLYRGSISDVEELRRLRQLLREKLGGTFQRILDKPKVDDKYGSMPSEPIFDLYDFLEQRTPLETITRTSISQVHLDSHLPRSFNSNTEPGIVGASIEPPLMYLTMVFSQLPKFVEPEVVERMNANEFELLMSLSKSYRRKLRGEWPLSPEEAKLRLFVLKNTIPAFSDINLENPAASLSAVIMKIAEKFAVPMRLKASKYIVQGGTPKAKANLLDLLNDIEWLNDACRILFKENLSFAIFAEHLKVWRGIAQTNLFPSEVLTTMFHTIQYNFDIYYDQIPHFTSPQLDAFIDQKKLTEIKQALLLPHQEFLRVMTPLSTQLKGDYRMFSDDDAEFRDGRLVFTELVRWLEHSDVGVRPPIPSGEPLSVSPLEALVSEGGDTVFPSIFAEEFGDRVRDPYEMLLFGENFLVSAEASKNTKAELLIAKQLLEATISSDGFSPELMAQLDAFVPKVSDIDSAKKALVNRDLNELRYLSITRTSRSRSCVAADAEYLAHSLKRLLGIIAALYRNLEQRNDDYEALQELKSYGQSNVRQFVLATKGVRNYITRASPTPFGSIFTERYTTEGSLDDRLKGLDEDDLKYLLISIKAGVITNRFGVRAATYLEARNAYYAATFRPGQTGMWISASDPKSADFYKQEHLKLLRLKLKVETRLYDLRPGVYPKPVKPPELRN